MNDIGNRIKFFREQLGLNQSELAKRAALSQSQISEFESGKIPPKIDKLLKIADALGQSVGVFDERLLRSSGKKECNCNCDFLAIVCNNWKHLTNSQRGEIAGIVKTYADENQADNLSGLCVKSS